MWALIYFLVFAKEMFYRGQILIPLSIILFSLFVLVFSLNNKEINFTFAKKIVSLISASTLEIYLVQVTYQRFVHFNLFPIGLLCFWIFSLAIGCGFHISLSSMKQKLRKWYLIYTSNSFYCMPKNFRPLNIGWGNGTWFDVRFAKFSKKKFANNKFRFIRNGQSSK